MFAHVDQVKVLGVALLLCVALLLFAFFIGWLDRLIAGPDRVPPPLDDPYNVEETPGVDGAPEEVADQLPPMTLDERMRYLAADAALRYGTPLTIGEVRSDYEPPVAGFQDEESDETDGSDEDRVVEPDEDNGYPRGRLAPFAIWDRPEDKAEARAFNAMGAVPVAPADVMAALEAPTGSWDLYDRNSGSVAA